MLNVEGGGRGDRSDLHGLDVEAEDAGEAGDPDGRPAEDVEDVEGGEPVGIEALQPEWWRPRFPWWPGFGLLTAILTLPLLSMWLIGEVAARLPPAAPERVLLDLWGSFTNASHVAGGVLVFVVPIAALVARRNLGLTRALLDGGYQVGVALVALTVLLHGVLAFAVVMAVEWLVLGTAIPATASVLAFFALACAVYLLSIGLARLRADVPELPAVRLRRDDAPALFERIERIAGRLSIPPPDTVLLGPEPGVRAGRGTVRSLDGPISGDTMEIGLPTLALASTSDLEAMLTHELAHLANGDTEVNTRLVPAFDRIGRSIESLETEANGIGMVAAQPAILWLRYAGRAMTAAVHEHLRRAEAAADAAAAVVVDPEQLASALLAEHAISIVEDEWVIAFRRAVDDRDARPIDAFGEQARRDLAGADAQALILDSLARMRPDAPALLTRLRALGMEGVEFELATAPAIGDVLAAPDDVVRRLLDAIRSIDVRRDELRFNTPRLTPGLVGWAITGLVFAGIFIVRLTTDGPTPNALQLVLVITTIWLAFPLVYPRLQHEAAVDARGIRIRSWWRRWLDLSSGAQTWREVRWTGQTRLDVRFEAWLRVSNGLDSISWWGGMWPRREVDRLVDALRERGADVGFERGAGFDDPERFAVVWSVAGRFLLPTLRRAPDGSLVEVLPIKTTRPTPVRFTNALIDRLGAPVATARPGEQLVQVRHLAEAAELDIEAFEATATSFRVVGSRDAWDVAAVDGSDRTWSIPRGAGYNDLADLIRAVAAGNAETAAAAGVVADSAAGEEVAGS